MLAGELRTRGYDVWTDQGGIVGAQDWSSEIVGALNAARTIIFLISKDSVTSHNCAKEIHLAGEKHKNILPVLLDDTPLPVLFEYPLAGLQRVPYERTDAIVDALEILRSGRSVLEAMLSQSKIDDGFIHLAVLPFEDQSPSQDNEWFASGMMDELIDTLGSLSHMKVNPKGDVIYYHKKNRPKLEEIAADLKCRYIVDGAIQKAGERIRIKVSLTDVKKHEQIWHEKYDGTFDDIFDLQEKTCFAISEALKLKLTPEDEKRIDKKPTENAEAYELFLKAGVQFRRHTREGFTHAMDLLQDAISLDENFANAHWQLGIAAMEYYSHYNHDAKWVELAERSAANLESIEGESKHVLRVRSIIAHHLRKGEEALAYAMKAVELDPEYASGWDAVAWAYQELGRLEECVDARERDLRLRENDTLAQHSYLLALNELGAKERMKEEAIKGMPVFERHLRLERDDAATRSKYIFVLGLAGEHERALAEADKLLEHGSLDGLALYNLGCFFMNEHLPEKALHTLRLSFERGLCDSEYTLRDPDLVELREHPEFKALILDMQKQEATEKNG